jgi:Ubiquitin family/Zinc finger, C3HC4 type (RING finger)
MKIFVKFYNGRLLTISIGYEETILALKQEIFGRTIMPIEEQILTFAGHVLQEEHTIQNCKITNGATIFLSMRLVGGGKHLVTPEGDNIRALLSIPHYFHLPHNKGERWRIFYTRIDEKHKLELENAVLKQKLAQIKKELATLDTVAADRSGQCAICYSDPIEVVLDCTHTLCNACLHHIRLASNLCPYCRQELVITTPVILSR